MKRLEKITEINKKVNALFLNEKQKHVPMFYDELATRPLILFIGINPALPRSSIDGNFLLNRTPDYVTLADKQRKAKNEYLRYYWPFHEVGKCLGMELWDSKCPRINKNPRWEHIDLFFSRTREGQKNLEFLEKHEHLNSRMPNDFGKSQIKFTQELISIIDPVNIVVVNKEASDIFIHSKLFKFQSEYDSNSGTAVFNIGGKREAKVFFFGTWSYGRLDTYIKNVVVAHLRANMKKNELTK